MNMRSRIEHRLVLAWVSLVALAGDWPARAACPSDWAALVYWGLAAWHFVH